MGGAELYDYQLDAMLRMKKGCILRGGVGSGKSRTSLAYYYTRFGGKVNTDRYTAMKDPKDLYIITTARKRDTLEWEGELVPFLLSPDPDENRYENKVVIDSWNNIGKYSDIRDAFFIFDEQRVVGSGAWVKAFLKIAKGNEWILLSATPGDSWMDYIPVFVANGFYRNRSEFLRDHVVFCRFSKYPKVDHFINTGKLNHLRRNILVEMDFERETKAVHEDIHVDYDLAKYREAGRTRWDPYKGEPIQNAGSMCYIWRRITNEHPSRGEAVLDRFREHPKMIIFYNFDYELETLRSLPYGEGVPVAEWNGHRHEPVPVGDTWVYLVQYTAGCEGWNCITTDTILFYSQNYSYKVMAQAAGRIDRLNTPYKQLWYYHLKSQSAIDLAIARTLKRKGTFNESKFVEW